MQKWRRLHIVNFTVWQFHKSAFRLSVVKSKGGKCILEPMRTKTKKTSKQPQARENAGDQVVNGFSLHLIGCDTSFLDQSQSEVELNQSNPWLLLTLNWKLLCNVIVLPVSFQRRFPPITSNLSGKHKSFAVCLSTLSAIIIFWKIMPFVVNRSYFFIFCSTRPRETC